MKTSVIGDNYRLLFSPETCTLKFEGNFRLSGNEENFSSIEEILNYIAQANEASITLDLQNMKFLNSLGISVISKFVINVRNRGESQLTVIGASRIAWQVKLIRNLNRLMPSLKFVVV